jgi:tRNA A-37 threonylcarbamoyl transferase component Bud32
MTKSQDRLHQALADRYRIEREIGQGGMATVYLASDIRHDRQVAVKVLRPDLSASIGSERFLQEIRIAARLGHPHILPLHDSGDAEGLLYYVMPYISGESLRQRLAREGELPVGDTLRILRDVADALAYAHQHGVVHRDIKPENILLSGRHALVADFGVAKAVSEATGRSNLTTAGVALGTPAYMAPEQAVADPHVDHRADIYALGVVGYEMCAGEPPFTGHSPQQVLAAHMTTAPQHVSARRTALPPTLADTLMRCLEKRPADRWQSAGELLAQLEAVPTSSGGITPTDTRPLPAVATPRPRRLMIAAALGLVALAVVAGIWRGGTAPLEPGGETVLLRDRTQLTFTGRVQSPAISPDGKQLAFVTKQCTQTACSYAVEVQDIGGTATRRVLEGAASAYFIDWSPDRRHLLVTGTIDRRWGTHLVSLLGGAVRRLGTGGITGGTGATFLEGGDSLLLVPALATDTVQWISVTDLSGAVRDSVPVRTGGQRISNVNVIPGTRWILVSVITRSGLEYLIMDRQGRVADRRLVPFGETRLSGDAIWSSVGDRGEQAVITRTPFDSVTGRLGLRTDTVYSGRFTLFSVTADGTALVKDEGAYQHSVYALTLEEALAGRFSESSRILQGSTSFRPILSPDGRHILVRRSSTAGSRPEYRLALIPFEGGTETPVQMPPGTQDAFWNDSVELVVAIRSAGGLTLSLVNVLTGVRRNEFVAPDSVTWDHDVFPGGGWIWIPEGGQQLRVHSNGRTRTIPKPAWYDMVLELSASPARVAVNGWNAGTADTMRLTELSAADDGTTAWFSAFVDNGNFWLLDDGSMIFVMFESEESATLIHITAPRVSRVVGTIPRPIQSVSLSADLERAVVSTADYFGDVWLTRVTRR